MGVERQQRPAKGDALLTRLGGLVLQPPEVRHLDELKVMPRLAEAFSSLPHTADGQLNEEESAALHQATFGFNILPFAGVYLSPDARVGGSVTDRLLSLFKTLGTPHDPRGESPEHLGVLLPLIGELQGRAQTRESQAALDQLIDACLLAWLPPFCLALQQTKHPYFATLGQMIWQEAIRLLGGREPDSTQAVASETDLLNNPQTGLRQIAVFLATPSRCGCLLSLRAITTISRQTGTPRGFGGRQQMLETLLFSAADQDRLPRLIDGLL